MFTSKGVTKYTVVCSRRDNHVPIMKNLSVLHPSEGNKLREKAKCTPLYGMLHLLLKGGKYLPSYVLIYMYRSSGRTRYKVMKVAWRANWGKGQKQGKAGNFKLVGKNKG